MILHEHLILKNLFTQKHLLETGVDSDAIKMCKELYDEFEKVVPVFLNQLRDDAKNGTWTEESEGSVDDDNTFAETYGSFVKGLFNCIKNVKLKLTDLEGKFRGLSNLTWSQEWTSNIVRPSIYECSKV